MKEYITLTVDGKSVKIEKGSTLLEAARKAGADIPTLCHDERVKPYGACGMCVVECKGSPKLMRSCAIEAADGMEIITESDRINRARRFSLEMLLSDHTGDCKAPCSLACPAGTDCQGYVGLIANGGLHGFTVIGKNWNAINDYTAKIESPDSVLISANEDIYIVKYAADTEDVFGKNITLSNSSSVPAAAFSVTLQSPPLSAAQKFASAYGVYIKIVLCMILLAALCFVSRLGRK